MKESTKKDYPDLQLEAMLSDQGYAAICGVDEAGRGPLAGPVVAAALSLPAGVTLPGCTD